MKKMPPVVKFILVMIVIDLVQEVGHYFLANYSDTEKKFSLAGLAIYVFLFLSLSIRSRMLWWLARNIFLLVWVVMGGFLGWSFLFGEAAFMERLGQLAHFIVPFGVYWLLGTRPVKIYYKVAKLEEPQAES
jgi:hypothetical protein